MMTEGVTCNEYLRDTRLSCMVDIKLKGVRTDPFHHFLKSKCAALMGSCN